LARALGILITAGCLAGSLWPAIVGAEDLPPMRSEGPPYFTCDVAISLDRDAHPALAVSISLPYSSLDWIRVPHGYAAGVALSVAFEPHRAGRIYGDAWERRVSVGEFSTTNSHAASVVEHRTLQVPPGHYNLRVTARDLNGELTSYAEQDVEVPNYANVPVGFADLELGVADSLGANFEPVSTREFGLNVADMAARVRLFDRRAGSWPRSYTFHYRLLDDTGREVVVGNRTVTLSASAEPVVVKSEKSSLFVGSYVLEVSLVEGKSKWRVDRSFEVTESGPPRGKDFERMLEPLSYIATPAEISALQALSPDQQAKGWDDFWRPRDPTPDTPKNEAMLEFIRRVSYAERHFQGYGPGWRSDMGRIYIKLGPPDQIENHPPNTETGATEIWYYTRPNRRFIFEDREGFGRYVLRSGPE
jgi:GWxTD domain-containing protein